MANYEYPRPVMLPAGRKWCNRMIHNNKILCKFKYNTMHIGYKQHKAQNEMMSALD